MRVGLGHRVSWLVWLVALAVRADDAGPVPARTTQLVVVLAPSFTAWRAQLQRYERAPGKAFQPVGPPMAAVIGHAGYGWGDGLHGSGAPSGVSGPLKREGDGRSPAGVFALGSVHGYAPQPPAAVRLPYVAATPDQRCVDDPASEHYNRIVSVKQTPERWRSAERMHRDDDVYELALDIEHNRNPVTKGHGSCIFAHIWLSANQPVTGCTALSKRDLTTLLEWLKPREATWVALPSAEYQSLRQRWSLP